MTPDESRSRRPAPDISCHALLACRIDMLYGSIYCMASHSASDLSEYYRSWLRKVRALIDDFWPNNVCLRNRHRIQKTSAATSSPRCQQCCSIRVPPTSHTTYHVCIQLITPRRCPPPTSQTHSTRFQPCAHPLSRVAAAGWGPRRRSPPAPGRAPSWPQASVGSPVLLEPPCRLRTDSGLVAGAMSASAAARPCQGAVRGRLVRRHLGVVSRMPHRSHRFASRASGQHREGRRGLARHGTAQDGARQGTS